MNDALPKNCTTQPETARLPEDKSNCKIQKSKCKMVMMPLRLIGACRL
jgi:hypothetical protein